VADFLERPCSSCRQILTSDSSGLCEDCQPGIPPATPGSITDKQRLALVGLFMDQSLVGEGKWAARARLIASVIPDWQGGSDLGTLSARQAGDLLEYLEERRLSQEARGQ